MICSLPLGDLSAGDGNYCVSRLQDTGEWIDHRGDRGDKFIICGDKVLPTSSDSWTTK